MSGFELLSIFVNDDFNGFMKIDKDSIDFRDPLSVSQNILPPILKDGASAVAACIFKGAEKCLAWIISNTNITELYDLNGRTLFSFAAASSNPKVYTILENSCPDESQNQPDQNGYLPIHYAAMFGNLQVLQYLWMNGADLNAVTTDSKTLLDIAVEYLQPDIVNFLMTNLKLSDKDFQSIFLLESHTRTNVIFGNNLQKVDQILNYFINAGVDISEITNKYNKKLIFFNLEKEDMDMVKILLKKNGNADIKNECGLGLYEFARRYKTKEIQDIILEYLGK